MKFRFSVLLVEDDGHVRSYLVQALRLLGFQVIECADAMAASESLAHDRPHLILTDCNLPQHSGTEFIKAAMARHKRMPIIGMSAEHFRGVEMLAAGATAFIEKPVEIETLRSVLNRTLAGAA